LLIDFPAFTGLSRRRRPSGSWFVLAFLMLPGMYGQELLPASCVSLVPAPASAAITGDDYLPLSRHERWHGYLHETFLGTQPALRIFSSALIDHIGHAPVQWGVGFHGYTHRLENRIYSNMIDGSVHASLAALLGHDTRYLRSHERGVAQRMGHAVERTLFTVDQSGSRVVDVSGLAGVYAGAMIPMFWHPRGYSPLHQGVQAGNFGMIFQAGSNLMKEFRPDIYRLFVRK
jgi:hypothetical protein